MRWLPLKLPKPRLSKTISGRCTILFTTFRTRWKDLDDPRPTSTKYARDLGLDVERFAQDMDGAEVQQLLAEDKQRADSLGIQGTPTILIDGRQLKVEVTTPEGIRRGIDVMLAHKGGKQ